MEDDNDENAEEEVGNTTNRSLRWRLSSIPAAIAVAVAAAAALRRPTSRKVQRKRTVGSPPVHRMLREMRIGIKKPAAKITTTMDHEEESDVEVLEAPAPRNVPTTATATARNSDSDEIEVIGTVNQVLLPHMRQHCLKEPCLPIMSATGGAAPERCLTNMKVCSLCYCYVCDVEASKCPTWQHHCYATDSGPCAHPVDSKRQCA
jgi:hypothetical protein